MSAGGELLSRKLRRFAHAMRRVFFVFFRQNRKQHDERDRARVSASLLRVTRDAALKNCCYLQSDDDNTRNDVQY